MKHKLKVYPLIMIIWFVIIGGLTITSLVNHLQVKKECKIEPIFLCGTDLYNRFIFSGALLYIAIILFVGWAATILLIFLGKFIYKKFKYQKINEVGN